MKTYSVQDPSSFEGVVAIVRNAHEDLKKNQSNSKKEAIKGAFSKLLESIYDKYKHFESFQVFDSVSDFKYKIGKYFNKNKKQNKRKKQKAPPSGISNWETFWENW